MKDYTIHISGDQGVMVQFGDSISPEVAKRVWQLRDLLSPDPEIQFLIPSYTSLLVGYDALQLPYDDLILRIENLLAEENTATEKKDSTRIVDIPVLYGGSHGPDLSFVMEHTGLTKEEVIEKHTTPDYLIYMLGFTPGFPYLGGMDSAIATPRLTTPRLKIEAGAVGIAGEQTGIYPISSPGGWQIIGNTPVKLYRPEGENPILLRSGDILKFRSITLEEYEQIAEEEEKGCYIPQIREVQP